MHTGLNTNCPLFLPSFVKSISRESISSVQMDRLTDKTRQSWNSLLAIALKMHLKWVMLSAECNKRQRLAVQRI